MSKKLFILFAIVAILVIGISVVAAQGNGNGNGNGNCDPQQPDTCTNDPQYNAYNYGGLGFVNAQNGQGWNGQQRGRMNRGAGQNGVGFYATLPPAYEGELPQAVIDLMINGWLDEQHAYAVYGGVIEQFGNVRPFVNIQQAEAQHIAAWEFLFDRYEIAIPDVPTVDVPQFASLTEACQIAADAEIANFGLYDTMIASFAEYPDLYQVTLALRNASEFNHLPAFESCTGE
jgi:hypothetical protein